MKRNVIFRARDDVIRGKWGEVEEDRGIVEIECDWRFSLRPAGYHPNHHHHHHVGGVARSISRRPERIGSRQRESQEQEKRKGSVRARDKEKAEEGAGEE